MSEETTLNSFLENERVYVRQYKLLIGHPENLVRTHLGEGQEAAEKLGEALPITWGIVANIKRFAHNTKHSTRFLQLYY